MHKGRRFSIISNIGHQCVIHKAGASKAEETSRAGGNGQVLSPRNAPTRFRCKVRIASDAPGTEQRIEGDIPDKRISHQLKARSPAALESQIAELSEAVEQCRKIRIVAKAVTAAGSLLLVVTVLGMVSVGAVALVLGIAAVLGGLALLGSNERTHDEVAASI